MPENQTAWEIIQNYESGFLSRRVIGKSIIWNTNFNTIRFAFKIHSIPENEQPDLVKKIRTFLAVKIEEEKEHYAQHH